MSQPLDGADATWLDSITYEAMAGTALVKLNVPVGADAHAAAHEELVVFDAKTPGWLWDAARAYSEAMVRFVRERHNAQGEPRCVTCDAPCCGRVFSRVHVTAEDRLVLADDTALDLYPQGVGPDGFVGTLKRKPWRGEGTATWEKDTEPMACVFLDEATSICTVYERRPRTCRVFVAHDCDKHEQATDRLVQIRRKAFTTTEAAG